MALSEPLSASTILFQTDSQLIALSERVVHARVVAQRVTRVGPSGHRIFTVTTLAILEDFTGREGDTVDVWELGGTLDGQTLFVGGQVRYAIGEEVLVCLDRGSIGLRSVAMGFSKFSVVRTGNASAQLRRGVDANTSIVGGVVPAQERSLDEFRALAATVLRTPSRVVARPIPDGPATVSQPWTKIVGEPGWRWRDADQKVPVLVYRNVSAPSPLLSGDGVTEIETALAAWTNPTTASIILQYAGTALESSVEGGWSTIPAHSTLITFEDPGEIIGSPVLALGGGMASVGTGGTVGGVVYDGIDFGFMVFQNAADLPASFRQPLNFSRIVTHELGHTIGFGHTQESGVINPTSNIMFPNCCTMDTPVPPSLGPDDLLGLNTVYPAGPATGPTMALDRLVVRMGATTSGGAIVHKTSNQTVRLTQSGAGTVSWTATATRPWIQVSPSSGTGPANLVVSLVSSPLLPASGAADAAVVFAFTGAANSPGPVSVRLTLAVSGTSALAFGNIDTPINQTAGITGAIPVTGWALDDIEVSSVVICRAAVGGEAPTATASCGGAAQFFVGTGLFIDGARPDVQGTYPTYPMASRAGWGFMILTNMLPGGGNGTYQLFAYAHDREGRARLLGNRVITCDNAHAIKPFGTIDTPTQGGTASGTSFVNFGWALTPLPKTIPTNGSTITVLVDGVSRGTASYNHPRSDIAALFPGYNNSNGPVGFKILDTSTLTNGLHTISWVVTDNLGVTEGVGSRFFSVSNTGVPLTENAVSFSPVSDDTATASVSGGVALRSERAAAAPRDIRSPLVGRRGWDLSAPLETFEPNASGTVVVRSQEVNRVELRLPPGHYTGHLRRADGLAPLPVGAVLDEERGIFTWAPGVGFVGAYNLMFVRWQGQQAVSRKDVRILIGPKGSGLIGPQVVIDTPAWQQDVAQPFLLAGWAVDLNAAQGTGVGAVHAWAYPLTGGAPIFLGAAAYGGSRPDVAGVHGEGFEDSGFGLAVQGLVPGHYDVAVFAWSTEKADFVPAKVVRLTAR